MKQVKQLFIGVLLAILGLVMFLQKLTFKDPSNTGIFGDLFGAIFGNSSPEAVSGVMVVVIFVAVLIFAFYPNFVTLTTMILSILIMIFTVVASLKISIATMSGLELGIILTFIVVGIGISGRASVQLVAPSKD